MPLYTNYAPSDPTSLDVRTERKNMEVKMAKKQERNLNVTIQNHADNKDEVVVSLGGIFKKLKKYFLPWLIVSVMIVK